jgi:hypothetical protein
MNNKVVVCQMCKEEIQVKSKMAYQTLYNHMKEHK